MLEWFVAFLLSLSLSFRNLSTNSSLFLPNSLSILLLINSYSNPKQLRPLRRFKAHSNTSQNFIRAKFAHSTLLVSGSEDGVLYMWDRESSEVLQTLEGHEGVVSILSLYISPFFSHFFRGSKGETIFVILEGERERKLTF